VHRLNKGLFLVRTRSIDFDFDKTNRRWPAGSQLPLPARRSRRVDLESSRRITQTMALFIADWCGLEKI